MGHTKDLIGLEPSLQPEPSRLEETPPPGPDGDSGPTERDIAIRAFLGDRERFVTASQYRAVATLERLAQAAILRRVLESAARYGYQEAGLILADITGRLRVLEER